MKKSLLIAAFAVALAGCETTGDMDDGYLRGSSYSLSAAERAIIASSLTRKLGVNVSVSGLDASQVFSNNNVVVCGYVTSRRANGTTTPPAVFAGHFPAPGSSHFEVTSGKGAGQDPGRIAGVRAICNAAGISI